MKTIDISELLLSNPDIDEQSVIDGIRLTEELKNISVETEPFTAEVPYSSPLKVVSSPSQRYKLCIGMR
jgi:hypothetical protein